jgi:hypothetical protein
MGFFGSNSQTIVSSSVYNLAGDIKDRPNFLKTAVLSGVVGESGGSVSDTIRQAYRSGPGMSLRNFSRWAAGSSGYDTTVGFTSGQVSTGNKLDGYALAGQLPKVAGSTVNLQSSDLGYGDITWWAEQRILVNKPTFIGTNWHCDYVNGQAVITYADGSKESFIPTGFDPEIKYIFATYTTSTGAVNGTLVTGSTVNLGTAAFPSVTGWTRIDTILTPVTLQLTGGPTTRMNTTGVYQKDTYQGIDPTNPKRTHTLHQIMYQTENVVAAGATTAISRSYRIDSQDITNASTGGLQVFIYPFGSGNAVLDAMFALPDDMGTFFPYIPIRIDNKMVSDSYQPAVYAMAKKAYKKATGAKFDDLVAKIQDNASIGDIDYAYIVFGASLNSPEITAKKYIWAFFEAVMDSATFSPRAYTRFKTQWATAQASQDTYNSWVAANGGVGFTSTNAPPVTAFPALPTQSIEIKTSNTTNINFDMKISWNGIEEDSGAGMADVAHAAGDMWWTINGADTFSRTVRTTNDPTVQPLTNSVQVPNVTLWWQVDANNWKSLTLYGLLHQNFIYNGKSVDISGTQAINDTEESGFIIPMHEDIFKSMTLKDATQMATASCYIVLNCYQVVKKKWYQTGLFSVIMIIVIIVITILTWGAGTGPAAAAYSAIGTAVGLTGTAAIIAGMAISMIAAMVLSKILGAVAKAAFGDKVGAIVGAIATVVVMVVGMNMAGGANLGTALSQLTSPSNLLQLTNAVGQGVSQYVGYEAQDIIKQTNDMLESYNAKEADVQDAYKALGTSDLASFDPTQLTDTGRSHTYEPASSFLNRTLMTGSDIAELTTSLISEFTSLTLDPNQNLVT